MPYAPCSPRLCYGTVSDCRDSDIRGDQVVRARTRADRRGHDRAGCYTPTSRRAIKLRHHKRSFDLMRITDSILLNDKERVGTASFSAAKAMTKPHTHDKTAHRQQCARKCETTTPHGGLLGRGRKSYTHKQGRIAAHTMQRITNDKTARQQPCTQERNYAPARQASRWPMPWRKAKQEKAVRGERWWVAAGARKERSSPPLCLPGITIRTTRTLADDHGFLPSGLRRIGTLWLSPGFKFMFKCLYIYIVFLQAPLSNRHTPMD